MTGGVVRRDGLREAACSCAKEFLRDVEARIERGESISDVHCECECHTDDVGAREDVRVGTLSDDERCRRCGNENTEWVAPHPLWNYVMRGNDIDGEWRYSEIVCVRCFIVLAHEAGLDGQWRLYLAPEPDGLVYTTPSGRVWNPETWMWDEPADAVDAVPDVPPTEDMCPTCGQHPGDECDGKAYVPPDPPAVDRDEVAALVHPWLDGSRRCPYHPQSYCPNSGRSRELADALIASGDLIAAADVRARALEDAARALDLLQTADNSHWAERDPALWLTRRAAALIDTAMRDSDLFPEEAGIRRVVGGFTHDAYCRHGQGADLPCECYIADVMPALRALVGDETPEEAGA